MNSTSDRKMNDAKILLSKTKKLTLILILYFSKTKFDQKQVPEINLCRKKLQTNIFIYSLDHFTTKINIKFILQPASLNKKCNFANARSEIFPFHNADRRKIDTCLVKLTSL